MDTLASAVTQTMEQVSPSSPAVGFFSFTKPQSMPPAASANSAEIAAVCPHEPAYSRFA